jgi:hypothetical protein
MKSKYTVWIVVGSFTVILIIVAIILIPKFTNMISGSMQSSNAANAGLVAVSADGKALPIDLESQLPENTATQKAGNLNITLALSPYPPISFQQGNFEVTLVDENGQAIADATVVLDLTMPAMPMPSNKVEAKYTDNGLYQGKGRFTMGGLWRIEVIVQRGGEKKSAFFDLEL